VVALATAPEALEALARGLLAVEARGLVIPPRQTVAEWCDAHRMLSRESNASGGPWRTDRAPYQREPLNLVGDLDTPEVVLMWSSQVGKTELLLNGIAYLSACDPCPQLVVQPTIQDAESFSRKRVAPMIRDTPALRAIYADAKSRDGANTLLEKQYASGVLTLRGANAPSGLAGQPIRVVWFDEVDRAPASAGDEGDPISLAARRTETFWNAQRWYVSSPTTKGASRIEDKYAASSQGRYYVPCPDCGHRQTLRWRDDDGTYRVVFERDAAGEVIEASGGYTCEACGVIIPEQAKRRMLAEGAWVHAHPTRRAKGYHLNALYSPWATWAHVCREFLASRHSRETLRQFDNTMLGLPFNDDGERVDPHTLAARAEPMDPLPLEVAALTAGVDVQANRVEALAVGWGARQTPFILAWLQAWGDPQTYAPWQEIGAWLRAGVGGLRVRAVAVDTQFLPEHAWAWCQSADGRSLGAIPVKGMSDRGRMILARPVAAVGKGKKRHPWLVGTSTAKDALLARATAPLDAPGRMRFADTLDPAFYEQLTAEEVVTRYAAGRPVRVYEVIKGRRNEALDLTVYAYAALHKLGPVVLASLTPRPASPPATADEPPAAPPSTPRLLRATGGLT
jgi:phage terminase large subunit GpA-like protein